MKSIKRILIVTAGGLVLVAGIALLVLPGPAFIVIPLGLAILALEFPWARRWLGKIRGLLHRKNRMIKKRKQPDFSKLICAGKSNDEILHGQAQAETGAGNVQGGGVPVLGHGAFAPFAKPEVGDWFQQGRLCPKNN
ncbi:MAG TPA: PGPGW domain-containing protein [Candidatus Angelobacter sp.]|nr:PGPGW domain-containing protein [Candidatus Angelobacter sp.]